MRRRSRRVRQLGFLGLLAVGTAACGAGLWFRQNLLRPYAAWSGPSVVVELEPGLTASAMLARLGQAGVLRNPDLLRAWVAIGGAGAELQAGEYRFDEPASPLAVLERLRRGDVLLHTVTIPEGLTLEEIAERVARAGLSSYEELMAAFRDPRPLRDLDPRARDLEGYLFPETYRFPRSASAARIAETLVRRFREATGEDYLDLARRADLDLRQAVTLASMIERETSRADERARVSRVFHNRLRRGMRMQCDPTVLYGLHRAGRPVSRLLHVHLKFDSPWNTYVIEGLPPGPIASPGLASLEAAVSPGAGEELYFVASPGGGHRFSSSLDAHLDAVADWRAYARSSR